MRIASIVLLVAMVLALAVPRNGVGAVLQPDSAAAAKRIHAVRDRLPAFERQLDQLKARGDDVSYPLVTYTVLNNFTGYALEDLDSVSANNSADTAWKLQRVDRELSDMEKMADRLEKQLNAAAAGQIKLPIVPRWTGNSRPTIEGPSFMGLVKIGDAAGPPVRQPIFFVGYGHFDQVRSDIEKFPAYGINIVQHAEFGPSSVYPREGQTDDAAIDRLIDELDRAAKAGVAVDWLISAHYLPDWIYAKYPKLRTRRADFFPYSIYVPEGRDLVRKFVQYVVPKIRNKPALLSICLSNEPINCEPPSELSTAAWRQWLKIRHGDIATLNTRWAAAYASFDQIPQPNPLGNSGEPRPGGAWCDFCRWNDQYFADFHKLLADAVHEAAPELPVHIKVTTLQTYRSRPVYTGDNLTLLSNVGEIDGNDSINLWSFGRREGDSIERGNRDFAQGWRENALAYEIQRSVHDAPVFNSENHLIFDAETRYVEPAHIRAGLWMGAIHGQSATTLWVWERATSDPRNPLAGDIIDRASCAEAVGVVCHDLNCVARQITAIQKAPHDVMILQNGTSAVWEAARYDAAMMNLFTALSFTGLKIGFVTETQLEQNKQPAGHLLIVPDSIHLSDAAFRQLSTFKGKILFASTGGPGLLTRNEYDQPLPAAILAETLPLSKSWQETLDSLRPRLDQAGITPPIGVLDANGAPQAAVQWQLAKTEEGLVVNLYNASHDPMNVIVGPRSATVDLVSGDKFAAGQKITLQPMEVRLLLASESK